MERCTLLFVQQRRSKSQKNVDEPGPSEYFQVNLGQVYFLEMMNPLSRIGLWNLPKVIWVKSPNCPHIFRRACQNE